MPSHNVIMQTLGFIMLLFTSYNPLVTLLLLGIWELKTHIFMVLLLYLIVIFFLSSVYFFVLHNSFTMMVQRVFLNMTVLSYNL